MIPEPKNLNNPAVQIALKAKELQILLPENRFPTCYKTLQEIIILAETIYREIFQEEK